MPSPPSTVSRRGRRQRASDRADRTGAAEQPPVWPGMSGGHLQPLNDDELELIRGAILELLARTGFAEAPDEVVRVITDAGGTLSSDRRLTFPRELVELALDGFNRSVTLHGQRPGHEMELAGTRVHMGSGGASPEILDLDSGRYRASTLGDLYDAARLVDALDNVHFFSRSMVARDMPDERSLDINTAYACLAGTTKHVCVSAACADHAKEIAEMCFVVAGSREAFAERPFLSFNINHVTPPMRIAGDAFAVIEQAARLGIPAHVNVFGQVGASSPVSLAGAIAQSVAEALAGGIYAWLINPAAKVVFGPRTMITDLRTGGMSGGGGEQAVATAATVQVMRHLDLPNSCIAGATDSKLGDAQSGYEKALAVSLAAQAGCHLITQACGAQASLLGCALESYVIDNDMLGSIMSALRNIEVNADTLATDNIDRVVRSSGHFLGETDTYARMKSDFLYPQIADRRAPSEWEEDGSQDIREVARKRTRELLDRHYPGHLDDATDNLLRQQFDIRLPRERTGR